MSAARVWLLLRRVFISKHSLTNKSNYLTSVTFAELTKEGLHKNQKMWSLRIHAFGFCSRWKEKKKKSRVCFFLFVFFSFFLVNEHISPGGWGDGGGRDVCLNDEATRVRNKGPGVFGSEKLIWRASWPRPRRQSRSPCRWGRCWWTPRACKRCSGTSRWPSSLWGCRSLCTSLPPPGEGLSNVRNLFKS